MGRYEVRDKCGRSYEKQVRSKYDQNTSYDIFKELIKMSGEVDYGDACLKSHGLQDVNMDFLGFDVQSPKHTLQGETLSQQSKMDDV